MFVGAHRVAQLGLLVVLPMQVLLIALFGIAFLKEADTRCAERQRATAS